MTIPQRYRRTDRQLALTIPRSATLRAATTTIILDLQCTAVSLQSTKQTFCFTHCEYQFTQMSVFYCITRNQHKKRSMLEQANKVASQSSITRQTPGILHTAGCIFPVRRTVDLGVFLASSPPSFWSAMSR